VQVTVLVATTRRWFPTARLGMALANVGYNVEALCPPNHPLSKTSAVRQIHTYRGLTPLKSLANAIAATKPDLIISGDDLATRHLHQLHRQEQQKGKTSALCVLIERSLGAPESFPVVYARTAFMELAQKEGIRVPKTEVIADAQGLKKWVAQTGFPTVLKANGTSGGDGVRVVHTLEEAEHAFRVLQAPPRMARAAKRAVVNQDHTLVWPSLLRRKPVVNAQAFIAGSEATSAIACWQGTVLAGIHCEVINKADSAGHATVVRLIESPEIATAAEKIVRKLNLSGLHGLDFMLEADTGNAYLIEINPRATQLGHLALGQGRDLPAALYAAVSGESLQPARKVTENDTIALFPQEWIRDSASPFLQSAYHDVPWGEPELIRMCVSQRRKQSAWYSPKTRPEAFSAVRLPRL
jgi:ATP-grasp domain